MKFGTNLCKYRKDKKLSQAEIANQIGTQQSTYNSWESDRTPLPAKYSVKLAHILDVDILDLIPPEYNQLVKKSVVFNDALHTYLIDSQKQITLLQQRQTEQLKIENEQLRNQYS
ncbi:helix-turn-helix transcriptional regulator [Larkinella rosea]|uniref:XRE family transcriptional regulator n=1 Tax=Larkinella rosea TaxID=2025312 RepID=A0A3P1BHY1_9BACT|nr:helix-turn-helix transcriptional regulator [Larkinella rosea]RRB00669.1 XRE family transcriptional regulator [Larkinella rosea]